MSLMSNWPLLILASLWMLGSCQYNVYRQDPFAILSRTLLTYQHAACDGQVLNLLCPAGTKISIQLVQYGRTAPSSQVCPPISEYPRVFSENDLLTQSCMFPEALKIIEEKCHGQEGCSIVTAPEVFGSGVLPPYPCPGVRKYVEVAYKCKPTVFKSKVVCQGEQLKLKCDAENDTRIAIYSSSFSASGGTHIYCPSDGKADFASAYEQQACEEQYATEPVMKICHGQRSCSVLANGTSLGAPDCKPHHNIYLKTVYTCIHQSVLKPQFVDQPLTTTTSTSTTTTTTTTTTSTTTTQKSTTSAKAMPDMTIFPARTEDIKQQMKPAETMLENMNTIQGDSVLIGSDFDFSAKKELAQDDSQKEQSNFVLGFVGDFFTSYKHIKENKEKFILFISLPVAIGLSLFLAMFLWNMYRTNRLDRIAKSLRQPNLSQSTLCSASGSSGAAILASNGGGGGHPMATDNGTINAFTNHSASTLTASSPAHSPNCPPGSIDIEVEVGDHEVDTLFRDPGPRPFFMTRATPPLQDASGPFLYGTLNRRPQMTLPRPRSDRLGSETSSIMEATQMTSSISAYNGQDVWTPMAIPNGSVTSSSMRSESPAAGIISPIQQLDQYQLDVRNPRYSTVGRPNRGFNQGHHNHFGGQMCNSPVRSVVIVAPGDPIPPNLQPQQQLQLQQMSSDHLPKNMASVMSSGNHGLYG